MPRKSKRDLQKLDHVPAHTCSGIHSIRCPGASCPLLKYSRKTCYFWLHNRCIMPNCKKEHDKRLQGKECIYDPQWKTQLCLYHRYGKCLFGDKCRSAHGEAELRCYKDPSYAVSSLNDGDDLWPRGAAAAAVPDNNSTRSTRICRPYAKAHWCLFGDKCKFVHIENTRRRYKALYNAAPALNYDDDLVPGTGVPSSSNWLVTFPLTRGEADRQRYEDPSCAVSPAPNDSEDPDHVGGSTPICDSQGRQYLLWTKRPASPPPRAALTTTLERRRSSSAPPQWKSLAC